MLTYLRKALQKLDQHIVSNRYQVAWFLKHSLYKDEFKTLFRECKLPQPPYEVPTVGKTPHGRNYTRLRTPVRLEDN